LSQTDFKILKYVQTSEQQVCDFYIELLVHRKNNMKWTRPYVLRLITAFCELNWPSFDEMRKKDGNLTAQQFLTKYASGLPISTGEDGTQEVKSIANASGKLTQALIKVVGRHGELKRGYDLLMEDREILESFPIAKWNDYNIIPFETRYVNKLPVCLVVITDPLFNNYQTSAMFFSAK
jgi:hypothetical protein